MIVHVWRRATEAGVGPVVVACAEPAIAEAVRAAGGEAVLTDPACPPAPTGSSPRCSRSTRTRRLRARGQPAGRPSYARPGALRHVLEPLDSLGTDMATLANPTEDEHERHRPERGQGGDRLRSATPSSAGRSTSRARPRPAAPARSGTISASMPSRARRSSASPPCRRARWSCASGWSSCGRWSTA